MPCSDAHMDSLCIFLRNHPRDAKKKLDKVGCDHSATFSVAWFLCLLHARSLPYTAILWDWLKQHEAMLLLRAWSRLGLSKALSTPLREKKWNVLDCASCASRSAWSRSCTQKCNLTFFQSWNILKPFFFANGNGLCTTPPLSVPCLGAAADHQSPRSSQATLIYRMMLWKTRELIIGLDPSFHVMPRAHPNCVVPA